MEKTDTDYITNNEIEKFRLNFSSRLTLTVLLEQLRFTDHLKDLLENKPGPKNQE